MSREGDLDAMEDGRNAAVIASIVQPYIKDRIDNCVIALVQDYRGRTLTHDLMLGKIAEMAALMDMISNLDSTQRQGEVAANRELGRGKGN